MKIDINNIRSRSFIYLFMIIVIIHHGLRIPQSV